MNEEDDIYNANIKTRKNQNIYIENVEDLISNGNQDSNKDFVLNLNDNNRKKNVNKKRKKKVKKKRKKNANDENQKKDVNDTSPKKI